MALAWDEADFRSLYSAPLWVHGSRYVGPQSRPSCNYHWFGQRRRLQRTIGNFLAMPGAAQLSHIAIVGGGFGWTAEILATVGVNAISIDTSPYVVANEGVSEEAELRAALLAQGHNPDDLNATVQFMSDIDPNVVLTETEIWQRWLRTDGVRTSIPVEQEDLANNGSRNRVKSRLSNNMDAILTEFVLDSMETDQESLTLADRCEMLRPNPSVNVIHLVSGPASPADDQRLNNKSYAAWRALLDANGFQTHVVADATGRTY